MSRFKSNLYTVERRVWRNHKLCWIQNDDFTLFSGHHKTKIKEEDLPEWYVFGRYYIICAENPAFERSTFDSWDFFIWGNLADLEMLLQKSVENENDGYISKDLLKGLLVRIQDQIQIFRQTIPYFVTDRSSEMPIRIIICEL